MFHSHFFVTLSLPSGLMHVVAVIERENEKKEKKERINLHVYSCLY